MPGSAGRRLKLSPPRRLVCDLMAFASTVPTVTVERRMNLAPLIRARRSAASRPGWCALFTKAYAAVSARRPELRRSYLPVPWPHLFEHAGNIASVAIEREIGDEHGVLFILIKKPEQRGVDEIEALLRRAKEAPLNEVKRYRRTLRFLRWPQPIRRALWWYALNVFGKVRASNFGTFGVSVVAGLGACATHLRSPLTTTLDYGVLADDGGIDVRLTIDHRVLDAGTAARALEELEHVLCNDLVNELGYLPRAEAA